MCTPAGTGSEFMSNTNDGFSRVKFKRDSM